MTDQPTLEPIDERHIDFYGDDLTAVLVPTAPAPEIYVPIRPLCEYLGLAWSGQYERIKRDEVLREAMRGVRITRTPGRGGGTQELLCLPLELLPGWLFGITTNKIKDQDLREKIIRYRRECFRVLWQAFRHDIVPSSQRPVIVPTEQSSAVLAYEIATAVQHLAKQQMELEQRLGGRIDTMARWANTVETRLSSLEVQVYPGNYISDVQAAEVAAQVKALATLLTERDKGKNHYQGIFAELYRRFGVSSYKLIRREQLQAVLTFLDEWRQAVIATDAARETPEVKDSGAEHGER